MRLAAIITFIAGLLSATIVRAEPTIVGISDVRVQTMTDAGTIENGWVIVDDGRITSLGQGDLPGSFVGQRIDGGGGTLMPGLSDMHVHYYDDGFGPLFVANGITSVRNMTGSLQAATRDQAANLGALVGPRVYTSGPIIDGGEGFPNDFFVRARNPDQAIGAVRSQAATGFRAVKLYSHLDADSYRAAAKEARAKGLRIYSHVPDAMTVQDLLELKIDSIEHLDGYARALAPAGLNVDRDQPWPEYWARAERAKFPELVRLTVAAGTWTVPTFAITYGQIRSADPDAYFALPEAAYLPLWADSWRQGLDRYEPNRPFFEQQLREKGAFAHALASAGAGVLIGTDAPNPFVTPGYSIHDELKAFSDIGFSNREILRIATVEAARFVGEEGKMGVIARGARADLILLRGDPVADLAVLREPIGVMVNGHWHDRIAIEAALAQQAARMKAARARRASQKQGS